MAADEPATETFGTISGSMYEIDLAGRRVRRVTGGREPTARQEADGQWKTYIYVIPVLMAGGHYGLFFDWTGRGNGTSTSMIQNPPAALEAFVDAWDWSGTVLVNFQDLLTTVQLGREYERES